MSTPEQPQAPPAPYRPSTAATLGAAGTSAVAAAHASVTPTLLATGVQARAAALGAEAIIEALGTFAGNRRRTIIPLLQSQLLETFVHRTPDEIAKLLGKEQVRERQFLRRQAQRIKRDLPKVLGEADLVKRREAMGKLLAREKRYMGQREMAMSARAHSLVESLDIQDASPEGAYWQLGKVATKHTPGCLAMAGKFWPWPVLREVIAPPVHPGCACRLLGLQEAITAGLMQLGAPLPDLKDALFRARRYLALEEAILDAVTEEQAIALTEAHLSEAKNQKRYPKGALHGGEFMPAVGADLAKAKGALKKLFPTHSQRGERHVWLKGHHTLIPTSAFAKTIGGVSFTSPAGGTNVYRNGDLVGVPGEPPLHHDLHAPRGTAPAPLLKAADPKVEAAVGAKTSELTAQIEKRLQQPKQGPPVSTGQDGKAAHDALLANGFVVRPAHSNAGKGELRMAYISKAGHQLSLQMSRKDGRVVDVAWKPDLQGGGLYPQEWKTFQAGKEPPGFGAPPQAGKAKGKGVLGVPGGLFGGKGTGGHTGGYSSSWKPAPPPPPVVHPATREDAMPPGVIPNYDHVELSQKPRSNTATAPDGTKYVLTSHEGDRDHVASELLANAVYRKLGATTVEAGVKHLDDQTPDFASIPDVPLSEPPIEKAHPGQRVSSGIILRDAAGNVTIFEPKGHFGGYEHTFPKGGVERGLTPQQNAHKELWEETGLHAHITGMVGDYHGDTSVSRYYTGVLTGGTPTLGDETASVKTVSPDEAAKLLNKERDQQILADVLTHPLPTGAAPADTFPAPIGQRPAVAYPLADGKLERIKEPSADLGKHFMADALLANWEFLGKHADEIVMGNDGKPVRADQGGTLQFRQSGELKPFGPVPTEVWTMLGPRGAGFNTVAVTDAQKKRQAAQIAKTLTPAAIDELVAAAPFNDAAMRDQVKSALNQRVAWMGRYATGDEAPPEPLTGSEAAAEMTSMQQGLELYPEQAAALDAFAGDPHTVNGHLLSGAPKDAAGPEVQAMVKELDGLLRHVQTDDDVTAYMKLPAGMLPEGDVVGKTLSHKGYLQLALHPDAKAKGTMTVLLPAGAHALYTAGVAGHDAHPDQADVIAARGARLRIVRKTTKGGQVSVEAVLLP